MLSPQVAETVFKGVPELCKCEYGCDALMVIAHLGADLLNGLDVVEVDIRGKRIKAAIAAQSRERVQKVMDSINWNCLNFSVSNTQLRALRALLIAEIKRLK